MSTIPADDTMPEGDDFVAAEYVLGVLPEQERRDAARRIENDPAFARLVANWQLHFDPLNEQFQSTTAPSYLKGQIDQRLFGIDSGRVAAGASFWNSLAFWRTVAVAALALVVFNFAREFVHRQTGPAPTQLIASMSSDSGPLRSVAIFDDKSRKLRITLVSGDIPRDKSLELWLIAGKDAPVSLGVLASPKGTEFNVPTSIAAKLRDGTTLAISVEPVGGSPSGTPTGAVVAAGSVSSI
ncbi:anti-sigma factor [Phyllobacterium myrsinacearum]|uniref:Anti-sigma-K factor RskA n=1 Tax=Phyllobacterium myrsinacearum TaxID=28101 RepID=A0A839EIP8_9HYPH|nr:anti-sigma factor [Phyllobacterium myrsinacearum]MBA8877366.1 anti-sigma-K factor RskA [Phyllobacterium myrsinacearum]